MLAPFYCSICSLPDEKILIIHRNGKCPKEQRIHGFKFCPSCGYKLSSSIENSEDEVIKID